MSVIGTKLTSTKHQWYVRFPGQFGHDADWLFLLSLTRNGHAGLFPQCRLLAEGGTRAPRQRHDPAFDCMIDCSRFRATTSRHVLLVGPHLFEKSYEVSQPKIGRSGTSSAGTGRSCSYAADKDRRRYAVALQFILHAAARRRESCRLDSAVPTVSVWPRTATAVPPFLKAAAA